MNPPTAGPLAAVAHLLSPSPVGGRPHLMELSSAPSSRLKGKRIRRCLTAIDVAEAVDMTAPLGGRDAALMLCQP